MTFQDFFSILATHKILVLLVLLSAPWFALGICMALPGKRLEFFVLNFNLGMAFLTLILVLGYVLYATSQGGWTQVVEEADMLLLLAPFYYAGVSLWMTRQRVSLNDLPIVRIVQGIALITASYLLLSWILRKARIIIFAYVSSQFLVLILLGIVGLGYFGYKRLMGSDFHTSPEAKRSPRSSPPPASSTRGSSPYSSIDDELEQLRRNLKNKP